MTLWTIPTMSRSKAAAVTQVIVKSLFAISGLPTGRCESGHTAVGGASYAAQLARRTRK